MQARLSRVRVLTTLLIAPCPSPAASYPALPHLYVEAGDRRLACARRPSIPSSRLTMLPPGVQQTCSEESAHRTRRCLSISSS